MPVRDKQTGRRCDFGTHSQLDHRRPFSLGGATAAENLRLSAASIIAIEPQKMALFEGQKLAPSARTVTSKNGGTLNQV